MATDASGVAMVQALVSTFLATAAEGSGTPTHSSDSRKGSAAASGATRWKAESAALSAGLACVRCASSSTCR